MAETKTDVSTVTSYINEVRSFRKDGSCVDGWGDACGTRHATAYEALMCQDHITGMFSGRGTAKNIPEALLISLGASMRADGWRSEFRLVKVTETREPVDPSDIVKV